MDHTATFNSKMTPKYRGIIICGTDTDVGKTIVSALFVLGLDGIYWKPIQSGLIDGTDTNRVSEILNLPKERIIPEIYKFQAAVSPHWAAEKETKWVDPQLLTIPTTTKSLVIETAGGLMVPINRDCLQINLIQRWGFPVILVARSGLGTLNHTLLSIEALKKREIHILGIVINGSFHEDNPRTLEQISKIPVIAQLPLLSEISTDTLKQQWINNKLDNLKKYIR